MEKIFDELHRAIKLHERLQDVFVNDKMYQEDREWWVLGYVCAGLKAAGYPCPEYGKKQNPHEPDFHTYDFDRAFFRQVEICEVLREGRKRGQEYRDGTVGDSCEPVERPFSSFIRVLNKKLLRRFGEKCWLIIYHNMRDTEISEIGYWERILLANADLWHEKRIVDFNNCPYDRIYVIDSTPKALISLYPEREILISERGNAFKTIIK